MKRLTVLIAALVAFAGSAAAEDYTVGAIAVRTPWIRATPRGADVAGAYMTITNTGTEPDRLVAGAIPGVSRFEVHSMVMENGVAKMRPVQGGLEIKPGQSVALKPGALHVMLVGLKQPLQQGQHLKGTLTFEKAGKVEVEFNVESLGASTSSPSMPAMAHPAH
jgi:copper(I)-binding protein